MDQLVTVIGLIGIFAGVWMMYWSYLSAKRLELFQIYIDKFNNIITPDDMKWWSQAMNSEAIRPERIPEYEIKMLRYLNLVWEEYFLYSERMISKKLWSLWEPNICFVIKTDLCRQVFDKYQTSFGPNFRQWVEVQRG